MAATSSKKKNYGSGAARQVREKVLAAVCSLREKFGLNRKMFARLTGYSERAIAKWESGQPLTGPSKQRILEMQRLQEGLARIMKPEQIGQWLQEPNDAFAGLKPLEVIERGQIDRLWRMIYEVESGIPT